MTGMARQCRPVLADYLGFSAVLRAALCIMPRRRLSGDDDGGRELLVEVETAGDELPVDIQHMAVRYAAPRIFGRRTGRAGSGLEGASVTGGIGQLLLVGPTVTGGDLACERQRQSRGEKQGPDGS